MTHGGKTLDTCGLNSDDERRSSSGVSLSPFQIETGIVGRNQKADNGSTTDIKEEDTDVHALDRLRKITARIFCFSSSDSNDLGTDE